MHSVAAKDGNGALRPKIDAAGRLVGLQWGTGFVIPVAAPAQSGRRGTKQQAELAEIEALIAAGKVRFTRIVHTVINGRNTYRMQLVMDGYPTPRHSTGGGRVSFDLGLNEIAVAVERSDGTRSGWVEPLAQGISLDTVRLRREQRHLDRQHRAGSPGCFNSDGTHMPGRCDWRRSNSVKRTRTRVAELHRRLAGHRKTLHGALANQLFSHGADIACEKLDYVAWQKNFPRSVRDRDLFSAYLGLHVRTGSDGSDRLDLQAARQGWLHRQDVDGRRGLAVAALSNRRGRRHPPTRRSVARINARRAAKRQSRLARTFTTNRPTAIAA